MRSPRLRGRRGAVVVAALLLVVPALPAEEGWVVPPDADAHASTTLESGRFRVRFDPGAVTAEEARRAAEAAEAAMLRVEARTGAAFAGTVTLVLHGNAGELRRRTAAPEGVEGLTLGNTTVHLPVSLPADHEMAHVLARSLPRRRGAPHPDALLEEGFAVAAAPHADGIPATHHAAVEARLGLLPPLPSLAERWPAGGAEAERSYHVAGAWVEHLAATRG